MLKVNHLTLMAVIFALFPIKAFTATTNGWSEVKQHPNADAKMIATIGIGLALGKSGKIAYLLGPRGSVAAPQSPEVDRELRLWPARPVGEWAIEREGTTVILPTDSTGTVRVEGYENTEIEVWEAISAPGCFTLTASLDTTSISSGPVVRKRYRVCNVDEAVKKLRTSQRR